MSSPALSHPVLPYLLVPCLPLPVPMLASGGVLVQKFIPDARDALQEVNVLKQESVSEVEREMEKKDDHKATPGLDWHNSCM